MLEDLRRQLTLAVRHVCPAWLSRYEDDLVQTAMIRVIQLAPGESRAGFSTSYLWKVAFTVTVDEIRRQRRRPEDNLEANEAAEKVMAGPDPEALAIGRETGRTIQCCLACLGEDRRLAVTLHLQGHTVPEASRYLGWSPKRVANLTYRGLDDLRRCLVAKGQT